MADPIRYGVVGVTGRGSAHIGSLAEIEEAELVAGADVVEEYAREFEAEHDANGYVGHEAMLEAEDLDAVSVTTPSGTHSAITIDCAEAGVNVLCTKPLDVYVDRVDAMIEACDEHDVTLAGGFGNRFTRENVTARQWVEEGKFGDMILADVRLKWHRPQSYYEDGWHGTRDMDGGVLMQQAVHDVDRINWLMGGVESVYAKSGTLAHEMECEDAIVVALTFENGAFGAIEATTGVRGGGRSTELNGTEGSFNDGTFVLGDEEVEPDWVEPPGGHGTTGQIRDFVQSIQEGREPFVTGREARKAIELVCAAYASANLEREVRVDEVRDLAEHT